MIIMLAGCNTPVMPKSGTPGTTPTTRSLPAVDETAAKALLSPDESLQTLDFPMVGGKTVAGRIRGYRSTAYAVPMAAGQSLSVTYTSKISGSGFNIYDSARPQEAIFRGEVEGRSATVTAPVATTFVIRPYEVRAIARRGTVADYELTITRK